MPATSAGLFVALRHLVDNLIADIATVSSPDTCDKCQQRITEIDHWGKGLKGCIDCNVWINPDGTWRKIAEADIEALRWLRR